MNHEERQRHLVAGLVGPHRDVYLNDASFHFAIDSLAGWLIDVADLMADGGRWREQQATRRLGELMAPAMSPTPTDEQMAEAAKTIAAAGISAAERPK